MTLLTFYKRIFFVVIVTCTMSVGGYAQDQTVGLFVNSQESYDGYTLFTNSTDTYLVDNCGFMVHEWASDYRPGLAVYLLEDGSILRCGRGPGTLNGGGAGGVFEKISWHGEVEWSYTLSDSQRRAHHDIEPLPNGNFLALVWTDFPSEEVAAAGRTVAEDMWMEQILEIKMVGSDEIEIVWQWDLQDHLVQDAKPDFPNFGVVAETPGKMDFNHMPPDAGFTPGWAHLNSIDYNAELDQIIVSSKNMHEIWIIDHSTTTAEAKTSKGGDAGQGGDFLYRYGNPQLYGRGGLDDQVFFGQHNAEWIPAGYPNAGMISVFNNGYKEKQSQVVRWEPPLVGLQYGLEDDFAPFGPQDFEWSYDSEMIHSVRISSAQFLPNGNVLACAGVIGRFVEITADKSVVWHYFNPISTTGFPVIQGQSPQSNSTFRCLRYGRDYPAFEGRDLLPIAPLELDPLPSDCKIYELVATVDPADNQPLTIYGTIVDNVLTVDLPSGVKQLLVTNQAGTRMTIAVDPTAGIREFDLHSLPSGLYYLHAIQDRAYLQGAFFKN